MSRQTLRTRRRRARYLVVILFAFGCVSSLWDAQAASADIVTPNITSVTTLDSTGIFISDEKSVPVASLNGLTSIPGTTVQLSDTPLVAPITPSVVSTPTVDAPKVTLPTGVGNLTFTNRYGCNPATDYSTGVLNSDASAFIDNILNNGWSIRISCIKEGHSEHVQGSPNISLHFVGGAFDVDQINGQNVSSAGSESNRFYHWMKDQPNTALPWEVGGPHVPNGRTKLLRNQGQIGGPFFTNSEHNGHWHFGFKANTGTFAVSGDSVVASSSPNSNAPSSPQTPPVFIISPPSVKEEKVQPTVEVAPSDLPDPNGDGSMPDPLNIVPIAPVELPPVIDAPSVAPPVVPSPVDQPAVGVIPIVPPPPINLPSPTAIPTQPTSSDGSDKAQTIAIDAVQLQADYDRLSTDGVLPVIRQIAINNNIPFAVALGLVSRETHGRNELGDGGHGHCYLQIDDRSHGDWLSNHDWRDPAQCFGFGLGILSNDYALHNDNMFEALAAYNSGNGNVHKALHRGLSAEAYTAHADYASDVLARAGFYHNLLDSLPSPISAPAPSDVPAPALSDTLAPTNAPAPADALVPADTSAPAGLPQSEVAP